MVLRRWESIAGNLVLTTELIAKLATVKGKKSRRFERWPFVRAIGDWRIYRFDEGLTLETSAFLLFTVANLRFQLSC